MKKTVLSLFILSIFSLSFASETKTIRVKSDIKKVTVFVRGAQVERTGAKVVEEGITLLKFDYLSPDIDKNSIKINGKGAFTILSVTHNYNHLQQRQKNGKVLMLEDSLQSLDNQITLINRLNKVLLDEKSLVLANKSVNNSAGFDIEDLDDLADFYRTRLTKIARAELKNELKTKALKKRKVKVKAQIGELNVKWNKATSEIIVEVKTKIRTNAKINLSYYVRNAGWTPTYDIRVKDINSPVVLNYKAKVYQNTGVDWNNVKLTLSTNNPTVNATKPVIYPWKLYNNPVYTAQSARSRNSYERSKPVMSGGVAEAKMEYAEEAIADADFSNNYTQVNENQLNTSFVISIPYNIPSNGKQKDVLIDSHNLTANYNYFVAPKQNTSAFLLAKVSGWEKLNLLPGNATLFFEGSYTGKSYINPNITKDTLDLSLGIDKSVVVTRKKIKEFNKAQIIGANKTQTVGFEITIRNTKSKAIEVNLMDQLPISTAKEIEVEVVEISGAKKDEINGYLNWNVNLSPAETKSFIIKYTVKHPKNLNITLY